MNSFFTLLGWAANVVVFCYIAYLAFFVADPSMHQLMFVSGFTCLNVMLQRTNK